MFQVSKSQVINDKLQLWISRESNTFISRFLHRFLKIMPNRNKLMQLVVLMRKQRFEISFNRKSK